MLIEHVHIYVFCVPVTSSEIVERVMQHTVPPYRPSAPTVTDADRRLMDLMTRCWAEEPADRPSFSDVSKTIVKINDGK